MKNLMISQAVGLGQKLATAAHPLIGAVFSIFASVFGWNGADESATITQKILKEVRTMMKDSDQRRNRQLVQRELEGVMEQIGNAESRASEWTRLPLILSDRFPKIFDGGCWQNAGARNCSNFRNQKNGAAGASLLLEIQFTGLMVCTGTEVARYGGKFFNFAGQIKKAATLSRQHYQAYRNNRQNFGSSTHGLRKGSVSCYGKRGQQKCKTKASRDLLLQRDFCGTGESKCTTSVPCNQRKAIMQKNLDTCHRKEENDIKAGLESFARQTKACQTAANSMEQAQKKNR